MEAWYKKGAELIGEIRAAHTSENETAFWYLGQCGFVFQYAGKILMIDPVLNDLTGPDGTTRRHYEIPFAPEALAPDYVLCTHGHADHMAGPTLAGIAAASPKTRFLIPEGCAHTAADLGLSWDSLAPLFPGASAKLADGLITVTAFSAAHPTHITQVNQPDMALGYCISFGPIRVIHLGDTYLTDELLETLSGVEPPHIFLPPINGDDRFRAQRDCIGNMEAEEAAKLAAHLHADLSIPTHYDMVMDNTVDPLRFAAELRRIRPNAKWKIPVLGEQILYRV